MASDILHPADEIPGGLWLGAVVSSSAVRGGVVGHHWPDSALRSPSWYLLLPGPLGLGLAGLAARVVERLGGGAVDSLLGVVVSLEVPDDYLSIGVCPNDAGEVSRMASCLALTDRLAAAVGLDLQPGEVAGWVQHGDGWLLMTPDGRKRFDSEPTDPAELGAIHVPALANIDPTDWLGALRACVAEVTRGRPECPHP